MKWPGQRNQGPASNIKVIGYSGKKFFSSLIQIWKYHCIRRTLQRKLASLPTRKGPLKHWYIYFTIYHVGKKKASCRPSGIYRNFITALTSAVGHMLCSAGPKEKKGEDPPITAIFPKALSHVFFSTKAPTFKDAVCRLFTSPEHCQPQRLNTWCGELVPDANHPVRPVLLNFPKGNSLMGNS